MASIDAFRSELTAWLDENAPRSIAGIQLGESGGNWGGRRPKWDHPDMKVWLERAAARGLTAPTWPREYGGGGLTPEEAKVFTQELARRRLPLPLTGFGLAMRIGTELVAAIAVGVGVGYVLDMWLGTRPWLMVVFFFLGSAAGMLNVYRATAFMGRRDGSDGA